MTCTSFSIGLPLRAATSRTLNASASGRVLGPPDRSRLSDVFFRYVGKRQLYDLVRDLERAGVDCLQPVVGLENFGRQNRADAVRSPRTAAAFLAGDIEVVDVPAGAGGEQREHVRTLDLSQELGHDAREI